MSFYYCNECAKMKCYDFNIDSTYNFTGSVGSYQFNKFIKHTEKPNNTTNGIVSIFENDDYESYKSYILDTAKSGSIEIDDNNKVNIIFIANKPTGKSYNNGEFEIITDAVKIVLPANHEKIHCYPTSSLDLLNVLCKLCGKSIAV